MAELAQIAMPLDLRRLMGYVCASIGQLERQTAWGQAAGMKRSTVSRYLDLLETSYQLVRLPAYAVNRTKRLTQSPKVFWSDTAMALHLTKEREPTGFHFENLVVGDLLVWSAGRARRPGLFHWRTVDQHEVDVVVELPDGRLLAIEVKSAVRPGWTDVPGLSVFLKEYPEATGGLVLHGGTDSYALGERIVCAPWWRVL